MLVEDSSALLARFRRIALSARDLSSSAVSRTRSTDKGAARVRLSRRPDGVERDGAAQ